MKTKGFSSFIRKTGCFLFAFQVLCTGLAQADQDFPIIVFLKSRNSSYADKVLEGFTISYPDSRPVIWECIEKEEPCVLSGFILGKKPPLVVGFGKEAFDLYVSLDLDTPYIYVMKHHAKKGSYSSGFSFTGISMTIPPQIMLSHFKYLVPGIKTISLPYRKIVSGSYVKEAKKAGKKLGIDVAEIPVSMDDGAKDQETDSAGAGETDNNPPGKSFPPALRQNHWMKKTDGLWMLQDPLLYPPSHPGTKTFFQTMAHHRIPVFAYSDALVEEGAFASISVNYRSLGFQLSFFAKRIVLDDEKPSQIEKSFPVGTYIVLNQDVAEEIFGEKKSHLLMYEVDRIYNNVLKQVKGKQGGYP